MSYNIFLKIHFPLYLPSYVKYIFWPHPHSHSPGAPPTHYTHYTNTYYLVHYTLHEFKLWPHLPFHLPGAPPTNYTSTHYTTYCTLYKFKLWPHLHQGVSSLVKTLFEKRLGSISMYFDILERIHFIIKKKIF